MPSVSIDIEISGHGCFPVETFQSLSQVLVVSPNVNKYGVSTLMVSESWQNDMQRCVVFPMDAFICLIYFILGLYVAFNTVQVLNCRPLESNYQLSHIRSGVRTTNPRGGRQVYYHCTTVWPFPMVTIFSIKIWKFFKAGFEILFAVFVGPATTNQNRAGFYFCRLRRNEKNKKYEPSADWSANARLRDKDGASVKVVMSK